MENSVEVPAEPCGSCGPAVFLVGGGPESELSDFQRVKKWRGIATAS